MRVYRVKVGAIADCSSGFGFILTYPFASVIAAIIVAGYLYAAAKLGILEGNNEGES